MFKIPAKHLDWQINSPQVMGILNITPDSFYAASRHSNIESALAQADLFIQEGVNIIDIGAQSTRPGANMEGAAIEIERLVPIVKAIIEKYPQQLISVDTFYASVAEAALEAGAHIINDISCASIDENILTVVAKYNAGYIGMHLTGGIDSMHKVEPREDIIKSIISYFEVKKKLLAKYGIHHWVIDPGFGFGKSLEHNLTMLSQFQAFSSLGYPVLAGISRKSMLGKITGKDTQDRLAPSVAAAIMAADRGAMIVRVHDITETFDSLKLWEAINT